MIQFASEAFGGIFELPQKATPVEVPTAFIFRSENIQMGFGLEKEALLCEKSGIFKKLNRTHP